MFFSISTCKNIFVIGSYGVKTESFSPKGILVNAEFKSEEGGLSRSLLNIIDTPFIDCSTITDAVIYILEKAAYCKVVGDTYLTILHENVLLVPKYWGVMKEENWRALYELGIRLFEKPLLHSKLSTTIAIMDLIVKYGCEHSALVIVIKQRIFNFLKRVVQKAVADTFDLQFYTIKLLITVCEKLRKECRMAICKFGEEIFDKLLDMSNIKVQGMNEKKLLLIKFLLIIVECHHPGGVPENSDQAYAYNWMDWKKRLKQLNHLMNIEIEKSGKLKSLPTDFLNLTVEVYNQVFRWDSNFEEVTINQTSNDSVPFADRYSTKRRRVMCGFSDIIDRLKIAPEPVAMWPWLCVISYLVSSYPSLVNENDYSLLLNNMYLFLSSSKEPVVTDYLCRCGIALIDCRQNGYSTEEETTWNSILNSVLRTIGLNQNVEWSHKLLRHMIKYKWNPSMTNAILKLYLSHVVRLSKHSLLTLYHLRLRVAFPNMILDVPVSSTLLRWMLPVIPEYLQEYCFFDLPTELLAHTVMLVCLRNNIQKRFNNIAILEYDTNSESHMSAAEIHGLTSYNSKIFLVPFVTEELHSLKNDNRGCVLNEDAFEQLLNLLEDQSRSLLELSRTLNNKFSILQYLSFDVIFILEILKFENYYEASANITRVKHELKQILTDWFSITNNMLSTERNVSKLIKLLRYLSSFFQQLGRIPSCWTEFIIEAFFPQLQFVFNFVEYTSNFVEKSDDDKKEFSVEIGNFSLFNIETLCEYDTLRVEACKFLVYFSFNNDYIHTKQYRVIERVLEIHCEFQEAESCSALLQMSVFSVQAALKLTALDLNIFSKCILTIQAICKTGDGEWCLIEESAVIILRLIQQAIRMAHRLNEDSEWEHLWVLVRGMCRILEHGGARTTVEIVHCLGLFTEIRIFNRNVTYLSSGFIEMLSEVCVNIFNFLKHPLHEVRLAAIHFFSVIFPLLDQFVSNERFSIDHELIINKFDESLRELFLVDKLTEEEIDESINRPLTVLYSLACTICCCKIARRKFILILFYLIHEKRLEKGLARKVMELIKEHLRLPSVNYLIKDNLLFILCSWYEKYKSFEMFPYEMMQCSSIKDFCFLYLKDIVAVLLFYGDTSRLNELAVILDKNLCTIFKDCFSEIIAVFLKKLTEDSTGSQLTGNVTSEGMNGAEMNELIVGTLGGMNYIEEMLIEQMSDVLTGIISHLHDPDFAIPRNSILPIPTPFYSNEILIRRTINYFQASAKMGMPLTVYIAKNYRKFIHKTFLKLYVDVMKSSTPEIKLEALQKYILFCELLLPYHQELLEWKMVVFITRTIINNLLNFIISSDEIEIPFTITTLNFYLKFLSNWLLPDESHVKTIYVVGKCLSRIVEKMVLLGTRSDEVGDTSRLILRYLINERNDCLFESIANLDQFPDRSEFEQFRMTYLELQETQVDGLSLMSDMKLFLNACDNSPSSSCRLESLKYLRKQLSSNKSELISIYKNCVNETQFSEDCIKSIPHRFVCALVQLTKFDDENVRYEAVCCLSEIGLVDLNTLVLQPNCDMLDNFTNSAFMITKNVICEILKDGIIDGDVEIVSAASRVLYMTLYSREGFEVVRDTFSELERLLIYPFIGNSSISVSQGNIWDEFSVPTFKEHVDNEILWLPVNDTPYATWVVNLVNAICSSFDRNCFLNTIQSLCHLKVTVAEKMLKYLLHFLHSCRSNEPVKILGNRINEFLKNNFLVGVWENQTDTYSSNHSSEKSENCIYSKKLSVKCLLNVVNFVRLNRSQPPTNEMNLNYLYISQAALHCCAYFTSVLYAELHVNSLIKHHENVSYDGNILSFLEKVHNETFEDQNNMLNILREAFSKIGDSDALYGCGSSLLLHPETRILHYQQIENWNRVFESCDTRLACDPHLNPRINDFAAAIGHSGFNYLQHQYLSSLDQQNSQLKDIFYESAWKLGKWDLVEPCDDEKNFSYHQYAALNDIYHNNYDGARNNVKVARRCLIPLLARMDLESTKNFYHIQTKLQCLQDIEQFSYLMDINQVIEHWKSQDSLSSRLNFKHKKMILNQRVRMMNTNIEQAQDFVLSTARLARKEHDFNFADECLSLIKNKNNELLTLFDLKVCFEEARVLWNRKETYIARYLLKELLKMKSTVSVHTFQATLLRTYGKWLSETNLENADTILENYFFPSVNLMLKHSEETQKEQKIRLKTYKQLAEFTDLQYQQICEYIKSDAFEEQIKSVSESKKQSEALGNQTNDLKKSKIQLANQSKIEDSQVKEIQNKEKRYLILALRYYLKVLAESEKEDLKIFRVVSFWLHQKTNVELHKELKESLFQIPSYKFVPVLPQLMAHISRNVDCFSLLLSQLIEKCAIDHPHHTLPLIFSLANYTKGEESENQLKRGKKLNNERVHAASDFIKKFRIHDSIGKIVTEMEILCDAYINLAYYKPDIRPGSVTSIPSNLLIAKIKNLENVCCLTITVPVNKQANYKNVIGVRYINREFEGLCGINAPKKVTCICTDGKKRPQLVKGQDDIRVDAVMQQIFTIMNKLLLENKNTSKRRLLLRTYKVVPLSQRSGVLEWCTNTISLSQYLTYTSNAHPGAHKRFRPNDMTTKKARCSLIEVRQRSDVAKLKLYETICQQLKPVFRYFFIEKFPLPTMWFERKLAYIHSVATTSMVGYIIGLGDRHFQNMLIDEKTAEIIHIDFGVAFDQGLTLNCPERIPFRLTRDIEDGMGIFSIDGIFRRCCEQVMTVLRENSEIIRTTSEVFIHDPLYIWTLTPEKRASVQDIKSGKDGASSNEPEINITASRALSRLNLKLQGLEEGTHANVEGQVNRLIQQAKDPRNLSRLFHGWQAFL